MSNPNTDTDNPWPLKGKYLRGAQYKQQKSTSSNSGTNKPKVAGHVKKKDDGKFHHDPNERRIQSLNGGTSARVFVRDRAKVVTVGSPEWDTLLTELGEDAQRQVALAGL